ncbi:MAG: hypothetical protein JSS76_15230 [Bacteroidetes bacterium]|nr:hypothetical protein [Bacteroidota bacterium]MBS1686096.1 hypothetical protein [Bacteroidota bacterium]
MIIDPDAGAENLEGDNTYPYYSSIIEKKLFPIGYYLPDGYHICCDKEGYTYMLGEYCYLRGKNLKQGIENIINGWKFLLQLDEDNAKWSDSEGSYIEPDKYEFSE